MEDVNDWYVHLADGEILLGLSLTIFVGALIATCGIECGQGDGKPFDEERSIGIWVHATSAYEFGVLLMLVAASTSLASEASFLDDCARRWERPGSGSHPVVRRFARAILGPGAASEEKRSEFWSGHAFDPQRNQTFAMSILVADNLMTTDGCEMGGLPKVANCSKARSTRGRPSARRPALLEVAVET